MQFLFTKLTIPVNFLVCIINTIKTEIQYTDSNIPQNICSILSRQLLQE